MQTKFDTATSFDPPAYNSQRHRIAVEALPR